MSQQSNERSSVAIDPRTLRPIEREADCHLIPYFAGVSDLTVRLDRSFDSKIGYACDNELRKFIEVYFGDYVTGQIALVGGSNALKGTISASQGAFAIPKPKGGTLEDFANRALGVRDGKMNVESFIGNTVDCARADASVVHSAFLVLHYNGYKQVFNRTFDSVRSLFNKAIAAALTAGDDKRLREMVRWQMAFLRNKIEGNTISVNDYRKVYDPSLDFGDGLLDDFPKRCVSQSDNGWIVTLPYSNSLRAIVTFER